MIILVRCGLNFHGCFLPTTGCLAGVVLIARITYTNMPSLTEIYRNKLPLFKSLFDSNSFYATLSVTAQPGLWGFMGKQHEWQ